jgi:hypothetical protein
MKTTSDKLVRGWRRRSVDSVGIAEAESAPRISNSQNQKGAEWGCIPGPGVWGYCYRLFVELTLLLSRVTVNRAASTRIWAFRLIHAHIPITPFYKRGCQDKYLPCDGKTQSVCRPVAVM